MASTFEKLQTINSVIRTLLGLVVVGGIGTASWYGYQTYTAADQELADAQQKLVAKDQKLAESRQQLETSRHEIQEQKGQLKQKDAEIVEKQATITIQETEIVDLNEDIKKKKIEIDRLDTALRLHKVKRRLARITVRDVGKDPDTGKTFSQIEFVELNELGDPINKPKAFELEGDLVYVDCMVVKFEDKYIEVADLERGTSICTFNRIFGEFQKPHEGFYLDEPGQRPGAYARGSVMSDFEKQIWDDFWNIANDPPKADELGIRALQGEAVSIKVKKGKTYRITIRASGGPEIEVVENGGGPGTPAIYSWDEHSPKRKEWPSWSPTGRTLSPLRRPNAPEHALAEAK
ncbi:MAG: hypothetical protein H8E44_25875 [Planctomycetes bacterium]|nr:hypothetical protein [Planctomycetota bacterium]MBL7043673.1 hypothetical protein [Pirellulaceae bacterium]